MIAEVDEALCRALARVLPKGTVVRLDPPKPTWQTEKPSQAIDLFLFNLAGDERGAASGFEEVRDPNGRVLSRQEPPRRYRLSYLATAWTPRPEDEHRLLSSMLAGLLQHEYFPPELLKGTLEGEEVPVLLTVALPPSDERKIADTWSALGGELKPSLDVVVTAPLNIARSIAAGPPVLEEPRLALVAATPDATGAAAAEPPDRKRRGGGSKDAPERPAAVEPGPDADTTTDEIYTAGALSAPGRRIRLRQISSR